MRISIVRQNAFVRRTREFCSVPWWLAGKMHVLVIQMQWEGDWHWQMFPLNCLCVYLVAHARLGSRMHFAARIAYNNSGNGHVRGGYGMRSTPWVTLKLSHKLLRHNLILKVINHIVMSKWTFRPINNWLQLYHIATNSYELNDAPIADGSENP